MLTNIHVYTTLGRNQGIQLINAAREDKSRDVIELQFMRDMETAKVTSMKQLECHHVQFDSAFNAGNFEKSLGIAKQGTCSLHTFD